MLKKGDDKRWFVAGLLALTMILAFAFPRIKYTNTDVLATLHIPSMMTGWISRDLSDQKDLKDAAHNFFGHFFARQYTDDLTGESLVFFVFDANNLHNPEICFAGSGYEVRPMDDLEIIASGRRIRTHTIFMKKKDADLLVVYWVSVDKKVTDWVHQKIRQLVFSIFNKKKISLMGRLDIPATEDSIPEAVQIAKEFIADVSQNMKSEATDLLFGAAP